MNNPGLTNWLASTKALPGILGLVIFTPGDALYIETARASVSKAALENAWRCIAETMPVLKLNQFPAACFRFTFGQAFVHCERRSDGSCIGVFAERAAAAVPGDALQRVLSEFHRL